DPLVSDGPRASQNRATAQADLLNPRRLDCPAGASKFRCQSVAELPEAAPQLWTINKTRTVEGRIEKHSIKSEIQKIERSFSAYMALRHSEVFGNVLSQSGAFWWAPDHHGGICGAKCPESGGRSEDRFMDGSTEGNWMAKQFVVSPKLPVRFYLDAGTFEVDKS